ncbi:PKD domain-containing protein [Candidatus Magnetomorum sp. HK-1]|nr:PKD domain-containing protein [Candidatus Magnetomorum sp. HK-1]
MKLKKIMTAIIPAIILLTVLFSTAWSYEETYLITFGKDASTEEGDDDFTQIIFIRIPQNNKNTVYIRIFDADCGGKRDTLYNGSWNTQTRFRLFGGKGAYNKVGLQIPSPKVDDISSGTLIVEKTFGVDPFQDNQWINFASIQANQGDQVDQYSYFKLTIEGISGDDGNTFLVEASSNATRNISPKDITIFTFSPTIHLPDRHVFSEMRLFVPPQTPELVIYNFDLYSAYISVETRFRTSLHVKSSGQNEWSKSPVTLKPNESGRYCAVRFKGGKEMPNDGTFYVMNHEQKMIPIELPIRILRQNNRPNINVKVTPLSNCTAVMFDASSTFDPENDAMTFYWEYGDGTTDKGIRTTHVFPAPGHYKTRLIVEDDAGQIYNSVEKIIPVWINQKPKAVVSVDKIAAPGVEITFDASQSKDPDGKILNYYWDFGDGHKAQGKTVQHAYNKPDFYQIELRIEDNSENPCNYDTDQQEIQVNARPVVEIGPDRIASPDQNLIFEANNSRDSDGKIVSFVWDMGDGSQKTGQKISHAYKKPGTYKTHLIIKDNANVANSTNEDMLEVFVNDKPTADAGIDYHVSALETISFDGRKSYDQDGKIILYEWDFGDGHKAKGSQVTHAYKNPGQYKVQLTVTDNSKSTSSKDIDNALVIINDPPISNAGKDQWITSSEVQFDGTRSKDPDGKITKFHWTFGDGQTGNGSAPVHVYAMPGTYLANLTVTDDSKTSTQSDTDAVTIIVNAAPIADAGPDQVVTPGARVHLDATASIDPDGNIEKYIWHLGNGTIIEGSKITYVYTQAGCYAALLEVHDQTGHDQAVNFDETIIYVNHPPVADAGPDLLVAPDEEFILDARKSYDLDGKIVSYKWTFSDNQLASNEPVVKRHFRSPGIYTAILRITDSSNVNNSVSQDQVSIHVNHSPFANPGKNIHTHQKQVFLDGSGSSDADGHLLSYIWDMGDGSPLKSGQKIWHHYASGGTYPVILTVNDGTGLDNAQSSASMKIQINESPLANAGENRTVCAGSVVIFNADGSIDPEGGTMKYQWSFGDNTFQNGVNPTKTFISGGIYPVVLTVTDDSGLPEGKSDTDQIIITVAESPVANAGLDQIACAGMPVQFDGSKSTDIDGLVNQFHWDFGDGTTGGGPNPTHAYMRAGKYRVELSITGDRIGNCDYTDTDFMNVTVYDAPTAKFTAVSAAAEGIPVTFDASLSTGNSSNIKEWNWNFGDQGSAKGAQASHIFQKAGSYIVTLNVITDSETDCNKAIYNSVITINSPPIAEAGKDRRIGVNEWTLFDASQSIDSDGAIGEYFWNFGDGNKASGITVRHQYEKPGNYQVNLLVKDNTNVSNNQDMDHLTVNVNAAPIPKIIIINPEINTKNIDMRSFCPQSQIKLSGKLSIDPDSDPLEFFWQMGDGTQLTGKNIEHEYKKPGTYTVVLTVNDNSKTVNSQQQTKEVIKVNASPFAFAGGDQIVSPNQKFELDASGSIDSDGQITAYNWKLDNSIIGTDKKIHYQIKEPGSYSIKLEVSDHAQLNCSKAIDTMVVRVNAPPVPKICVSQQIFQASGQAESSYQILTQKKGPITVFIGGSHDEIIFSAKGSYDPDGDLLTCFWDFGDNRQGMGTTVKHRYLKPGKYKVQLTVNDGQGVSVSQQQGSIQVIAKRRGQITSGLSKELLFLPDKPPCGI